MIHQRGDRAVSSACLFEPAPQLMLAICLERVRWGSVGGSKGISTILESPTEFAAMNLFAFGSIFGLFGRRIIFQTKWCSLFLATVPVELDRV